MTHEPMTDAQREAFRAYMHGLNRQAAIALGEDPDKICPRCGEDLEAHTSAPPNDECLVYPKDAQDVLLRRMVDPVTIIRTITRLAIEQNRPPDMDDTRTIREQATKLNRLLNEARTQTGDTQTRIEEETSAM